MKKFLLIVVIFSTTIFSQNKQVLYDFAGLPQTLLLNPALENQYKFHVGVPLISGISTQFGSTGVVLTDLFAIDNQHINDKVSAILNTLTTRDFLQMNIQVEILNVGYRLNEKTYLSGGFYQEIDAIGYYPKDIFILFSEGNDAYLNKSFSASQINYKLDVLGVLHAGITRKINKKVILGARFKIYSAALNIKSTNNTGTFTTVQGNNNIYRHYFSNVNIESKSAGLIDANDEFIDDANSYLKNTFLSGDLGFGFDFGITYKMNKQLQFSASILDFGFINHKKNIKNTKVEGDFIFDGIEFEYDASSSVNYWNQIKQRWDSQLPTTQNEDSYISWRPTKLNAALKYSFGEKRSDICYDNTYKDFYTDAVGAQLFTVFRPLYPQVALTAFYQKSFTKKLHAKVTYTVDDFSAYNIGLGLSAQLGKVNFYAMMDNLLVYRNLAAGNAASLQLGMNVIF